MTAQLRAIFVSALLNNEIYKPGLVSAHCDYLLQTFQSMLLITGRNDFDHLV